MFNFIPQCSTVQVTACTGIYNSMADELVGQSPLGQAGISPPNEKSICWSEQQHAVHPLKITKDSFTFSNGNYDMDSHCRIQVPTGNAHPRANPRGIDSGYAKLKNSDSQTMLVFQFQTLKRFNVNRKGWLKRERALLLADREAAGKHRRLPVPRKVVAASRARPQRNEHVSDLVSEDGDLMESVVVPISPVQRTEQIQRTVTREDKDFDSIPDYCPALSSLTGCGNLEIDWNYKPWDLSNDPHARLLHPVEVRLAEILRLECATYLTTKRRIFQRRLECFRIGKEFLKTDAQRACKIDVNKASKLWTTFETVGWLDERWMRRFL